MKSNLHPRSIEGFCARIGICRQTFYNHRASMPKLTKIGNRRIILEEDEKAWVDARAAQSTVQAAA